MFLAVFFDRIFDPAIRPTGTRNSMLTGQPVETTQARKFAALSDSLCRCERSEALALE